MTKEKVLYRYEFIDKHGEGSLPNRFEFQLKEYLVVKNTPQGYWILWFGKRKYVPAKCKASFAHLTPDRAMEAFIARRRRYHAILISKIKQNERLIKYAATHQKECEYETEQERIYREADTIF